jgi:acetyl/propionyl-CoA carboxylase alpha subunit
MKYVATVKGQVFAIEVTPEERVFIGDRAHRVDLQSIDAGVLYSLFIDNNSYEVLIEDRIGEYRVLLLGELYTIQVEDDLRYQIARRRRTRAKPVGRIAIKAPMPGLVVAVRVKEGDETSAGDVLVILESMKMENEVRAPRDGRVSRVQVCPSEIVERGQTLVVLT